MKPKKLKQQEIDLLKQRAIELWKLDYTTRQISEMLGKKENGKPIRSHAWVYNVVNE
jgi:hypothetical protein